MCLEKKEYDIIKMVQHGKYCERIQDNNFRTDVDLLAEISPADSERGIVESYAKDASADHMVS